MSSDLEWAWPLPSKPAVAAFGLGAIIGYAVWAAAPAVTGHRAPWDGSWPYYSVMLLGASALVALAVPRQYAAVFLGTAFGQLLAELSLPAATGVVLWAWTNSRYDWIGTLLTFPGTWVGSAVRDRLRRAG